MTTNLKFNLLACLVATIAVSACGGDDDSSSALPPNTPDIFTGNQGILVANRTGGDVSLVRDDGSIVKIDIPIAGSQTKPEPMYVAQTSMGWAVGDRANSRVVFFNVRNQMMGQAPTEKGIFHMWADSQGKNIYVANDGSGSVSIIDAVQKTNLGNIKLPEDILKQGGVPHDVFVDGSSLYVSIIVANEKAHDYVVRYDIPSRTENGRVMVGNDPHLYTTSNSMYLWVPSQEASKVHVIDKTSFKIMKDLAVPGAHGITMNKANNRLYVTNITSPTGAKAVYTINANTNELLGSPVDAAAGASHNLAFNAHTNQLFLGHSGPTSTKVSVFKTSNDQENPVFEKAIESTSQNPFGLAFLN